MLRNLPQKYTLVKGKVRQKVWIFIDWLTHSNKTTQPAITRSKLTIEALQQGKKIKNKDTRPTPTLLDASDVIIPWSCWDG